MEDQYARVGGAQRNEALNFIRPSGRLSDPFRWHQQDVHMMRQEVDDDAIDALRYAVQTSNSSIPVLPGNSVRTMNLSEWREWNTAGAMPSGAVAQPSKPKVLPVLDINPPRIIDLHGD